MTFFSPLTRRLSSLSENVQKYDDVLSDSMITHDVELQEFVLRLPTTKQPTGDEGISEISKSGLLICGHFRLQFKHCDSNRVEVDTLVRFISDADGEEISAGLHDPLTGAERAENSPGSIRKNTVEADSHSSNPRQKQILTCCLPLFSGDDMMAAKDAIVDAVTDCVDFASTGSLHKSICFSLKEARKLGYRPETVIGWIVEALEDRSKQPSIINEFISHIRTVIILSEDLSCELVDSQFSIWPVIERYLDSWRYQCATPNHVLIYNKINFEITCQCISKAKEEVVVNSTGVRVDLSENTGKALADVAGPEFVKACSQLRPLGVGLVKETEAYELKTCKKVFHCNVPVVKSSENNDNDLYMIFMLCLEKASRHRHRSVAFPAIGMDNKGYPSKLVAETMMSAVTDFCLAHPTTSVTRVRLYLPLPDTTGQQLKDFQWMMKLIDCEKQVKSLLISQRVRLSILKGSVADLEGDVLVNVMTGDMDLGGNSASSAVAYAAGFELKEAVKSDSGDQQIIVTKGFNLPASEVIHVKLPDWSGESEEIMKKTIVSVLDKAGSELRRHSIVFPALGRDGLKYPPAKVVWCMISSIVEYFRDSPGGKSSSLEEVSIVCNGRDEEVKTEFENRLHTVISPARKLSCNREDSATSSALPVPADPVIWQPMISSYQEVIVHYHSSEFRMVGDSFLETLNSPKAKILEIRRIQNRPRYHMYEWYRREVMGRLADSTEAPAQVERFPLWHGTSEESIQHITTTKFDRALAGSNSGKKLGSGSYFSVRSELSAKKKYSPSNTDGARFMIMVQVVTGRYCLGNRSLKKAPKLPKSKSIKYDSVVDDINNPRIYCVFEDASAYPHYVIKYKH